MSTEPKRVIPAPNPGIRRPYRKPGIEFIEINGDQVLATGCKTSFTASGSGGGIAIGCTLRSCGGVDGDS